MALRRLRECSKAGCHELTRSKEGYCEKHLGEYLAKVNQQKKDWKKKAGYKPPKNNTKTEKFYSSKEWQTLRRAAMSRDDYLCQECLKHNKITRSTQVHHKVEILKDWDKRFEFDNLVSLCNLCHREVYHHNKNWEDVHGDY